MLATSKVGKPPPRLLLLAAAGLHVQNYTHARGRIVHIGRSGKARAQVEASYAAPARDHGRAPVQLPGVGRGEPPLAQASGGEYVFVAHGWVLCDGGRGPERAVGLPLPGTSAVLHSRPRSCSTRCKGRCTYALLRMASSNRSRSKKAKCSCCQVGRRTDAAYTLHSPKRLADTVGVVLERTREEPGTSPILTQTNCTGSARMAMHTRNPTGFGTRRLRAPSCLWNCLVCSPNGPRRPRCVCAKDAGAKRMRSRHRCARLCSRRRWYG